jgi:hypothetical protein
MAVGSGGDTNLGWGVTVLRPEIIANNRRDSTVLFHENSDVYVNMLLKCILNEYKAQSTGL